jgi:putative salt-induced outer membrane protein
MRSWVFVAFALVLILPAAARARPLAEPVAQMVRAAADDPETLAVVARVARKANPDSAAEIDALVADLTASAKARKTAEQARQGFFQGWQGDVELGGNVSTGNTNQQGVAFGLDIKKEGPRWAHDFDATADYGREDNATNKERYFLAWSSHYKLNTRLYVAGVLWGESDRFAGYYWRLSESVGLGYKVVDRPDMELNLEAGAAMREANYVDLGAETTGAARAAEYFSWKFGARSEFTQSAVSYLDRENSTFLGAAAIKTRLRGPLSVRASVDYRYESDPPPDRKKDDTTTRLTLVYDF